VNGVFNGRTPVDPGRTVRVKVSSTSVVIESYEQCASSTVVRIVTILFIVGSRILKATARQEEWFIVCDLYIVEKS
jgi:hypothetical protein